MNSQKILITGGAGFIGLHLAKALAKQNYQIDLLDNFSRGVKDQEFLDLTSKTNVSLISCNLLNPTEINQLSHEYNWVFHFAAIIGVQNVLKAPYRVLTENIAMLENMIQFCKKQNNLERFFFTSTSEVYAGTLQHFGLKIPTAEETPLTLTDINAPRTSYMLSKIYGEAMCHHSNLPFTIIRPHNIYGPRMGMAHVIPELLYKAYKLKDDETLPVFSATHKRSFCYIDDAITQILAMMNSSKCLNQTINLGTESPEVSMYEIGEKVLKTLNKKNKMAPQDATPGSPARRAPLMEKLKSLTDVSSRISLEDGIQYTYEWYLRNIFSINRQGDV